VQEIFKILAVAKMKKYLVQYCFFKSTLWAFIAFLYAVLLTFELALASPASECLA
jgi:hypothetical protein